MEVAMEVSMQVTMEVSIQVDIHESIQVEENLQVNASVVGNLLMMPSLDAPSACQRGLLLNQLTLIMIELERKKTCLGKSIWR